MRRPAVTARAVPWVASAIVALVILGPVLRPGVLFNLDLIVPPRLATPSGFWGLGPELPRRLPMWAAIAWLSHLVPATVIAKVLMFAAIVGAWVGMTRLVEWIDGTAPLVVTQGAAALYALSPFVLTRAVVGHFMVTVPHAVLPWVLPVLLRRPQRDRTVFLIAAALGAAGHFGGSIAVAVVAVAAVCRMLDRPARALVVTIAAQSIWVVPGIVVMLTNQHISMSGTEAFPTHARGLDGLARLSAGGGFWNQYFQIGGSGWLTAVVGAVLLTLGVVGTRTLPDALRRFLGSLGALGWVVAATTALGGLSAVLSFFNSTVLMGIWRDSQRVLTLHLLWLAPTSALGARHLAGRCLGGRRPVVAAALPALPLGLAVVLATPACWGFGGQLAADPLPPAWRDVRELVTEQPGTVLVLPWYQYFNLQLGDGAVRRVLNPMPLFLGGDVLSSSDNGLTERNQESADPRERRAAELVDQIAAGSPVSSELGALGVTWVVVLEHPGTLVGGLLDDVHVERVVDGDGISLYRLDATARAGAPVGAPSRWHLALLAEVPRSTEPVVVARPASRGWFRGRLWAGSTDDGLLVAPQGTGPLWNAAAVVLPVEAAWAVCLVAVGLSHLRRVKSPFARSLGTVLPSSQSQNTSEGT
jgi:hypothetical protein